MVQATASNYTRVGVTANPLGGQTLEDTDSWRESGLLWGLASGRLVGDSHFQTKASAAQAACAGMNQSSYHVQAEAGRLLVQ